MIPIRKDYLTFIQETHSQNTGKSRQDVLNTLSEIQTAIQKNGDVSLCHYTKKFDNAELTSETLFVTKKEIQDAYDNVPKAFIEAIKAAHQNILEFHENQKPNNWEKKPRNGVSYGMQFSPIDSVGLYVPGGRAPYPSTVLMDAIPAKIAGVNRIVIATPPSADGNIPPQILVAADCCGVSQILKAGGSQAIFALAHGTQSIKKVNKIVGPGNIYVDLAKQMVYGQVDIDKPAGPSDVLVYCDDTSNPAFAAAELLAQLEHDPLSVGIAISSDESMLKIIQKQIEIQIQTLTRKDIILASIKNSALLLVQESEIIPTINNIAPEHLVLLSTKHESIRSKITTAGAIFCGLHTPVTLGDYFAGPNHVLPTSGTARFASPLSVMDFMRFSTYLTYTQNALETEAPHIEQLTKMEGFDAHFNAVSCRIRKPMV